MWKPIQMFSGAAGMVVAATAVAVAQQVTVDLNKVSEAGVGEKIGL